MLVIYFKFSTFICTNIINELTIIEKYLKVYFGCGYKLQRFYKEDLEIQILFGHFGLWILDFLVIQRNKKTHLRHPER